MTIDEIKSVSIIQFLETQGYLSLMSSKETIGICLHLGQSSLLLSMSILSKTYGMTMAKVKEVISLTLYRR